MNRRTPKKKKSGDESPHSKKSGDESPHSKNCYNKPEVASNPKPALPLLLRYPPTEFCMKRMMIPLLIAAVTLLTTAASAAASKINKGDHISIIGNTLADRMQHDGWLETYPPQPISPTRAGHPQPRLLRRRDSRTPAPLGRISAAPTTG